MALTRIKNNQVETSSVNADEKLVANSITSGLLENNLNYNSNLTVSGDLTVTGTTILAGVNVSNYLRSDTSDTFSSGVLTIGAGASIVWATAPSAANHLANKAYVDNAVTSGTVWRGPVRDPDLVGVTATEPVSPQTGGGYIATAGGTWTGSVSVSAGDYVYWTGSAWVFVQNIAAGDRFIVGGEHGNIESSLYNLGFREHDLVQYVSGSYNAFASWTLPSDNGFQIIDFTVVKSAGDSTGFANDATVYVLDVSTDVGSGETNCQVQVTGTQGQTFTNLISQINFDLDATFGASNVVASWVTEDGHIHIQNDATGARVTISEGTAAGTGMLATLTDFRHVSAGLEDGTTVLVNDTESNHYGHTYLYTHDGAGWTEISGPGSINAGANLAYDGNTLNVVGGAGSALDADLLDGQQGSYYLNWTNVTNKPDPTITLGGDATGSITLTDLAGGTLTVTVVDDSHNHIIANVDGLQTALDAKLTTANLVSTLVTVDGAGSGIDADLLDGQQGSYYLPASSYTAADVLAKLLTVDGAASNLDADLLDGVQGASYARSDATDTISGAWTFTTNFEIVANDPGIWLMESDTVNLNWFIRNDAGAFHIDRYTDAKAFVATRFSVTDSTIQYNGNTVWHAGNDGTGTGLDADLLDGQQGSYYQQNLDDVTFIELNANGIGNRYAYIDLHGDDTYTDYSARIIRGNTGPNATTQFIHRGTGKLSIEAQDNGDIDVTAGTGTVNLIGSAVQANANTIWHAGNDGAASGLDADLLDGQQGSYYLPASSYTASDVLTKLLTVDGAASGLDADLLDGQQGSYYLDWTNVTNKPDPLITLTGDMTGSGTMTDLGNVSIATTVSPALTANYPEKAVNETITGEWDFTSQHFNLSHANAEINMDSVNAPDGYGYRRITCNDGGGNWNFRSANYYSTGDKYANTGDGAVHMSIGTDAQDGQWRVNVAATGTADATITWANTLLLTTTTLTLNGNTIWHAGNDGSGTGLDADTVDGLQASQFLRSDATDSASGNLTFTGTVDLNGTTTLSGTTTINNGVGGNEGGELKFTKAPTGTMTVDPYLDVNGDNFRFVGTPGGVTRVLTLDFNSAGGTVWHSGNDGPGSGLNADAVDGIQAASFLRSDAADTHSATITPNVTNTIDLGSASLKYANVYATTFQGEATSAQYADLAELYEADSEIAPGTVVCFGGVKEVTTCMTDMDRRIAGVVSTNPAHLMNSGLDAEFVVALALQGRVPCRVSGTITKGDMLVSDGKGGARAEANPPMGSVIGKALENSEGDNVIEIVVGRM